MPGVSEPMTNAKAPRVAGGRAGRTLVNKWSELHRVRVQLFYLCPQQELLCVCHGETACGLFAPQMAPFWMPFCGQHPFPRERLLLVASD